MPESTENSGPKGHLRQVLAACAVSAGLELSACAVTGTPTSEEALASALQLGLPTNVPAAVVILVDGLGIEMLQERKGHAPTLRRLLNTAMFSGQATQISTCTPSTTAAALTTLGTGALPGTTGMVGYSVRHPRFAGRAQTGPPAASQLLNLITWENSQLEPRLWQEVPTIFERLCDDAGNAIEAVSVGPARFSGSGLTEAGLRGTQHRGVDRLEDRPAAVAQALREGRQLVYFYVGELDHTGHNHGWQSQEWLADLERLDAAVAELLRRIPANTLVTLTADHGMVDTQADHRVDLSRVPALSQDIAVVAGEPRMLHLYLQLEGRDDATVPGRAEEVVRRWQAELGENLAWIGTRSQVGALMGELSERAETVVGDVVVAMNGNWVTVDSRIHSAQAQNMPGVHGSITNAETVIPLLFTQA